MLGGFDFYQKFHILSRILADELTGTNVRSSCDSWVIFANSVEMKEFHKTTSISRMYAFNIVNIIVNNRLNHS